MEVGDEQRSIKSSWLFPLEAKSGSDWLMVSAFVVDLVRKPQGAHHPSLPTSQPVPYRPSLLGGGASQGSTEFPGLRQLQGQSPSHRTPSGLAALDGPQNSVQHVGPSGTRDQTHVPYVDRSILNHWTTKEVLASLF